MARIFRIHPAMGTARVGNANRDSFFIGAETPGISANFDVARREFRPFKDNGLIKPQAAQFRVWEYEQLPDGTLRPKREAIAGEDGVAQIEWTVHVANRKATFFEFHGQQGANDGFKTNPLRNASVTGPDREARLVIDPGKHAISGKNATPVPLTNANPGNRDGIPDLGELRTDDAGRLRVLGGRGNTVQTGGDIHNYVNNDGWFDDVSDGPVGATVTFKGPNGDETVQAEGAWVVVGPPDFAPAISNVVRLYDTIWESRRSRVARASSFGGVRGRRRVGDSAPSARGLGEDRAIVHGLRAFLRGRDRASLGARLHGDVRALAGAGGDVSRDDRSVDVDQPSRRRQD